MNNAKPKIEGYWYSSYEPEYPMPITNILSEAEAKEIHSCIKLKEQEAKEIHYKGFSLSRIEPYVSVGSSEFITEEWRWPNGFADHYVLKHRVKPSDEFLKYIGYTLITDKEKAEVFESLCSKLWYSNIAMNTEKIIKILLAINDYGRAGQGEYTEEEKNEQKIKAFNALKNI